MQITTDIVLDLKRPNINTIVHAKQNDKLSRYVNAALMDGPQPWTPPAGVLATVRFKKPDGHAGFYDVDENEDPAVVFTGSTAKITLAEQAISCPGNVLMELTMYTAAGERLSTFLFVLEVEESALTDEEIESTDYYSILTIQIAEVLAKIDSVAGITAEAESIPYGEETYVVVTGGTGTEDPYFLHFYIESARPLNPRGTYSASATYNKLDFVLHNGSSYVAMRDGITGVTPGTSVEDWQMLASSVSIVSQTYSYAAQTAAEYTGTPPASGWQSTPPQGIAGGYLWQRTVVQYADNSTTTNYITVRNGQDGQGAPGSASPKMDGTASAGTANAYSREDHVHPGDTSKVPTTRTVNGIALNGNITTRLFFENVSAGSWTELSSSAPDYNEDFPWRGTLSCSGVTDSMVPEVILPISLAMSGDFAPVAKTDTNKIYIYSANEPAETVTAATVIAWK